MEKLTLDCPKCGGTLELTLSKDSYICQYCSTPVKLINTGSSLTLEIIEAKLSEISKDVLISKFEFSRKKCYRRLEQLKKAMKPYYEIKAEHVTMLNSIPKILKKKRLEKEAEFQKEIIYYEKKIENEKWMLREQLAETLGILVEILDIPHSEFSYSDFSVLLHDEINHTLSSVSIDLVSCIYQSDLATKPSFWTDFSKYIKTGLITDTNRILRELLEGNFS